MSMQPVFMSTPGSRPLGAGWRQTVVVPQDRDSFQHAEAPAAGLIPRSLKADLEVVNGQEDGTYEAIQGTLDGQPVQLSMERQPHYARVGGILVETDPTFAVSGDFAGTKVDLDVQPEPQIADVGGLHVQTGTVYHVDGTLGDRPVRLDVTSEEHVADVGGLKVETGTTVHLKGGAYDVDVNRHAETSQIGDGIGVETDAWWTADGRSPNGDVHVRLDGLRNDAMAASGSAAPDDAALLVALRPFITAT